MLRAHLKLIDGHPAVGGEALEHWDQELEAARPVPDQQHHADQVEDAHEHSKGAYELERRKMGCFWVFSLQR